MSGITSLTSKEELQDLLQSSNNLLLDFYADWCPPCKQLMPVLSSLALNEKYGNSIKFIKINVSNHPELSRQYEISSIPTLIFISKDKTKSPEKHTGFIDLEQLSSLLDNYFF